MSLWFTAQTVLVKVGVDDGVARYDQQAAADQVAAPVVAVHEALLARRLDDHRAIPRHPKLLERDDVPLAHSRSNVSHAFDAVGRQYASSLDARLRRVREAVRQAPAVQAHDLDAAALHAIDTNTIHTAAAAARTYNHDVTDRMGGRGDGPRRWRRIAR